MKWTPRVPAWLRPTPNVPWPAVTLDVVGLAAIEFTLGRERLFVKEVWPVEPWKVTPKAGDEFIDFTGLTWFDEAQVRLRVVRGEGVDVEVRRQWIASGPLTVEGRGGRIEFDGDDFSVFSATAVPDDGWTSTPLDGFASRGRHIKGADFTRGDEFWAIQMHGCDGESSNFVEEKASWRMIP